MDAEAWADPAFDVLTVAVLLTVPHVALVVGEVMCTLKLVPAARLAFVHVSTSEATLQVGVPVVPATDQLRPAVVGSVSVIDTFVAAP
jgi:hypothetical protein